MNRDMNVDIDKLIKEQQERKKKNFRDIVIGIICVLIAFSLAIILFVDEVDAVSQNVIISPQDNAIVRGEFNIIVDAPDATQVQINIMGMTWQPLQQTYTSGWVDATNIGGQWIYHVSTGVVPFGNVIINAKKDGISLPPVTISYLPENIITPSPSPSPTPTPIQQIIITYPTSDDSILSVNFTVSVNVNDTGVSNVQARLSGNSWVALEQMSRYRWSGKFNIYDYPNGSYEITARYQKSNDAWIYGESTVTVIVKQSAISTNSPPSKSLREMRVSGYQSIVESGSMIYLKIKDKATGEALDEAEVRLLIGNVVKQIPGTIVNGRITVSFPDAGFYELDVTKEGYEDWAETITVVATPTPIPIPTPVPTPTPAPTPVPTVNKKFYSDAMLTLTDDEYIQWMAVTEEKKRNETLAAQNFSAYVPEKDDGFNYVYLFGALGIVGAVAFRFRGKLFKNDAGRSFEYIGNDTPLDTLPKEIKIENEFIKCELCGEKLPVTVDASEKMQIAVKKEHEKEFHDQK